MSHGTGNASATTRRQLLRTAAIGGTAAAAATLLSSSSALAAPAPASGSQYVKGVDVLPDTSHAASSLAAHIRGYYQAKTDQFTYIDGILGWHWYTRDAMRDALAGWYPTWPKDSESYPTRILGDTTSVILIFTDTAGLFGPGQVRNYGAVNFGPDSKIERVDYWDARQFGVATWKKEEEPELGRRSIAVSSWQAGGTGPVAEIADVGRGGCAGRVVRLGRRRPWRWFSRPWPGAAHRPALVLRTMAATRRRSP